MAIEVALHFSTQIISADSRQCFKELNIGVARPSPDELKLVPHYFIGSHSIHNTVNAAVFEQYALEKVNQIFERSDTAVMVGGTGLYIKTFCSGIDEVPAIIDGVRERIIAEYELNGLAWLQDEVRVSDPVYFAKGEVQNPQRLMRALEVKLSTGKSILEFHSQKKVERDFNIVKIGLELPRQELYQRINSRVDGMMEMGLVAEAKSLEPYKQLNALQTVGYSELFDYFEDKITLEQAIGAIQINTRHYAKRQMTWFKKDPEIRWCPPEISVVMDHIKKMPD